MTLNLSNIQALANDLAKEGKDLNNAQQGGDFEPPAAGACRARLVGYVEVGTHTTISPRYGKKQKPAAEFTFELSGPKHEPKDIDGKKYPHRIVVRETIGYNEKNGYMKLFKKLNSDGTAKTFLDLLGKAFLATVVHRKYKGADGKERTAANLKDDSSYTFRPTTVEDVETGELRTIKVAEAISPLKLLLWDRPDLDQWDSIFIDGAYDDGRSKNAIQIKCATADNFKGSALEALLIENQRPIPVANAPRDALAGGGDDAADPDATDPDADEPPETPAEAPAKPAKPPKPAAKGKGADKAVDPLAGL